MRNILLIFLIILNFILAGAVVYKMTSSKPAFAQPIGLSGNYIMVSGAILGKHADAVYIIDLENRKLHALYYDRADREITYHGSRDLVKDLTPTRRAGRRGRRRR